MQHDDLNEDEGPDSYPVDPKKLFDEKEYSTLIINREGFSKKENSSADLIEGLLEPGSTRAEHEQIFAELKKANAGDMLLGAIAQASSPREKKTLIAACWESGIDFSQHFLFFCRFVLDGDFETGLEALTVIEEMENIPSRNDVDQVLALISKTDHPNAHVAELKNYLNNLDRS
jgi:hypothetical protein